MSRSRKHLIDIKSYIDSLIEADKITAIKILQQKVLKDFKTLEWQNHHSDIFRLVTEELANADPKQRKVKQQGWRDYRAFELNKFPQVLNQLIEEENIPVSLDINAVSNPKPLTRKAFDAFESISISSFSPMSDFAFFINQEDQQKQKEQQLPSVVP